MSIASFFDINSTPFLTVTLIGLLLFTNRRDTAYPPLHRKENNKYEQLHNRLQEVAEENSYGKHNSHKDKAIEEQIRIENTITATISLEQFLSVLKRENGICA